MQRTTARSNLYFLTGLSAAFLFGLATPISKILLNSLNPFLLAGLLYLGAAIGLAPFLFLRRKSNPNQTQKSIIQTLAKSKKERLNIIGSILFGGILGPLLLLIGLSNINAGSVSIWLNFELVATAILGRILFKESIGKNTLLGVLCMLCSGIIISFNESGAGLFSILLVIAACFCWGFDNQFTSQIEQISPIEATFIKGLGAGLVNTTIGSFHSMNNIELSITQSTSYFGVLLLGALLLGAFSYGISIVLYITTAQQLGATRAQILFSSAPVIGVLLSSLILSESFLLTHIIAILLGIIGIYFSQRAKHAHLHTHTPFIHSHIHTHSDFHHEHAHVDTDDDGKEHSHEHYHEPVSHNHPHYPDLHHKHEDQKSRNAVGKNTHKK